MPPCPRRPPQGILLKNVSDLELAAGVTAFVFDKTGTLTTGKLAVGRLAPGVDTSPAELLRLAASAEQYSNHPTAKALTQIAAVFHVLGSLLVVFNSFRLVREGEELEPFGTVTVGSPRMEHGAAVVQYHPVSA